MNVCVANDARFSRKKGRRWFYLSFVIEKIIIAGTNISEDKVKIVSIETVNASHPAKIDPIKKPRGNMVWGRAIPTFASSLSTRSVRRAASGTILKPQANP